MATKAERVRLARKVRRSIGFYVAFQERHMRAAYPDGDDRAWSALLVARADLNTLIDIAGNQTR